MAEVPKRLTPTKETIRELFALSRNICAFPDCTNNVINEEGKLHAEICHIEAAEPGGERFNATMTNEERRSPRNLLILCGYHHTVTNDVQKYPTEKMKEMKEQHEKQSLNAFESLETQFNMPVDLTEKVNGQPAKTLAKFNKSQGYSPSQKTLSEYQAIHKIISSLPIQIRETLLIILKKMLNDKNSGTDWYQATWLTLKKDVGGLSEKELFESIQYLQEKSIVEFDEDEQRVVLACPINDNHLHWLLDFAQDEDIDLRDLIVNGNFNLLD